MKQNRWFKYIGMAAFALVLSAMAAPTAQALTVNAFVVRQSCVNGDIVAGNLVRDSSAKPASEVSLGLQ